MSLSELLSHDYSISLTARVKHRFVNIVIFHNSDARNTGAQAQQRQLLSADQRQPTQGQQRQRGGFGYRRGAVGERPVGSQGGQV